MSLDQTDIRRKIKNFVEDAALSDPVKFPNILWDETDGDSYWYELAALTLPTERLTLGTATRYLGSTQITVVGPLGLGTVPHDALANGIAQLFPVDLKIAMTGGTIRVIQAPSVSEGFSDDTNWRVPVTIAHEVLNTI